MGACCNNNSNNGNSNNNNNNIHVNYNNQPIHNIKTDKQNSTSQNQSKYHFYPGQNYQKNLKSNKQIAIKTTEPQITSEDIDKSIHKLVEKLNKSKKKLTNESNKDNSNQNCCSYNESEITKDFCEENKEMLRSFSEITSTIHLTNLTRDFVLSKVRFQNNITSLNNAASVTLFNVLEELEDQPIVPVVHQQLKIIPITTKDRSSLTSIIDRKKSSVIDNQVASNNNILINRSNFNYDNNDYTMDDQNNALIYSQAIESASDNYQDEIKHEHFFCGVNKIDLNQAITYTKIKYNNASLIVNQGFKVNGLEFTYQKIKDYYINTTNTLNANYIMTYPQYINDKEIEWKAIDSINEIDLKGKCFTLKQGLFDDSSLLSAMSAISYHDFRFGDCYFNNIIKLNTVKTHNGNNTFELTLQLNGRDSYTIVDSLLPFSTENKCLFAQSDQDSNTITNYINMIEKAFFILNNYDLTLASNFSIEAYHLIGWLPEYYSLSVNVNKEVFWNDLCDNFIKGNLLVCFGCHEIKDPIKDNYNRVYSKSEKVYLNGFYPIINIQKDKKLKMVLTKGDYIPSRAHPDSSNPDVFYMAFESGIDVFTHIYLSWNPKVYNNTIQLLSFYYPQTSSSKFCNEDYSLEMNPQFLIRIPPHQDDLGIKMLLMKHIEAFGKHETISFKLFKYEGYHIVYPLCELRTIQSLLPTREIISDVFCFEASDVLDEYVLVIIKKDNIPNKALMPTPNSNIDSNILIKPVTYSINLYSEANIKVFELPKREIYSSLKLNDYWSNSTQSDILFHSFLKYPHYKLTIQSNGNNKNHIQIKLETAILSNVMIYVIDCPYNLLKTSSEQFNDRKSPNFFSSSFSYIEMEIQDGQYTVLCISNDDQLNIGKIIIECNSLRNNNCQISLLRHHPIPKLPCLQKYFGEWDRKSNRGINKSNHYLVFKNPCHEFTITKPTKMCFYIKESRTSIDFNSLPHIYLSLYKIIPGDPSDYKIIFNGSEDICSFWGFIIEDIDLEPGRYVITCLNHIKFETCKFEGLIYSNNLLTNFKPYEYLTPRKYKYEMLSKWNEKRNSKYCLKSNKHTFCDMELISTELISVGLFITEYNAEDNSTDITINRKNLPNVQDEMYLIKRVKLEPIKHYALIPFSLSSYSSSYDITVFSDEELNIKEIYHNVLFV